MKLRLHYFIAILLLVIGLGGQLAYDFIIQPYVLSKPIVKVKLTQGEAIPRNSVLQEENLIIEKVPLAQIPKNAIRSLEEAKGKTALCELTNGMMLTSTMINTDELQPGKGEGIFPVPKNSIYAMNGTLPVPPT